MKFDDTALRFIERHGVSVTLKRTTNTYDPATGTSTGTETVSVTKAYPKHIRATQYYHPNLIGKDSVMFYIRNTGIAVENSMSIEYNGKSYIIDSYTETVVFGKTILYRIIGVKA